MVGSVVKLKTKKGNLYKVRVSHIAPFGIAGRNIQFNRVTSRWPENYSLKIGAFSFDSIKSIEVLESF